ncbi:MAG: hypothetical protein ACJAUP_000081 [Cellvibrionaceae bacterium]|jgi:hypothetical protein
MPVANLGAIGDKLSAPIGNIIANGETEDDIGSLPAAMAMTGFVIPIK